jgi:hypothetical protein
MREEIFSPRAAVLLLSGCARAVRASTRRPQGCVCASVIQDTLACAPSFLNGGHDDRHER